VKHVLLGGLCLVFVALPASAQSDAQKKSTIAYIRKLQAGDGGFRANARAQQSDLSAVNGALRVLKYLGGEPRDKAACIAFVQKCFDKEGGGFAARPGGKVAYPPTAVGIMAVVELKMSTAPYADAVIKYLDEHSKTFEEIRLTAASFEALGQRPPHAKAWLQQIAKMRNADGTYGKGDGVARDTGSAVAAVLRLGGKVEQRDNVLKALNAGQRKDGGFGIAGAEGSDLGTSYRIARTFHMLKTKPEGAERLLAFIARCRNEDGGYGVAPGQPSSVSGTYYASIIAHWLSLKG
jgi:hypothetical protein